MKVVPIRILTMEQVVDLCVQAGWWSDDPERGELCPICGAEDLCEHTPIDWDTLERQ